MTLLVETPPGREPERAWILDVLLGEYLGLAFRHETTARDDVAISLDGRALLVADVLLAIGDEDWLSPRALPPQPLRRWRVRDELPDAVVCEPELPVLYGEPPFFSHRRLGLDVFGASFLLLSRYEEVVVPERDKHDRFPAWASLAASEDFVSRPLVNEYAEVLWAALQREWPGLERRRRAFRQLPTHDVDIPRSQARPFWREALSAAADLGRRRDPALAARRLAAAAGRTDADPANTFDVLMDLSEAHGLRSAFYFIAERTAGEIDGDYSLDDPWLRRLLRRIHERGHEIGLHTSYGSYRDPVQIRRERDTLARACTEEGIEQEEWGGRGHYLRWENPTTWQGWNDAGLAYDSTLGFAETPGFRCGACFEYPAFNLRTRERLSLRERPLVAMEASALSYLRLDPDEAVESFAQLKRRCRLFGGDFVLLWHNDWASSRRQRLLYARVLDS